MEDRICGVCQAALPSRQLCNCGQVLCTKCANHITEDAINPRCPHCHRALFFNSSYSKLCDQNSRAELAKYRVIQRNLVYLIGLSPNLADEKVMSMDKFFGQYGRIKKCVVNKANAYTNPSGLSYSAYLTYHSEVEATLCIKACDGFVYEDREIKGTYGTTKYCNSYVKGTRCQNPECMYLHEEGSLSDTFTREDIQHNCHIQPHNSIFPLLNVIVTKPDKNHILPPARVQRARVCSEEFQTPPKTKPRVYSFDFAPRRLHSRFDFVEESNEDAVETPEFLRKILALNSPTQEIVKLPATEVPKLLRNSWVKDLLHIEEAQVKALSSQRDEFVLASSRVWT